MSQFHQGPPGRFREVSQMQRPLAVVLPHFGLSPIELTPACEKKVDNKGAKYSGPALSEWAEIVDQLQSLLYSPSPHSASRIGRPRHHIKYYCAENGFWHLIIVNYHAFE